MTDKSILKGKAWVCGDYTDAYKILPKEYWGGAKIGNLNSGELGKYAMAGVDPQFAADAMGGKYSFIVGGRNFGGGGKSIEHPIYAIKGAMVKAVLAESCSRYFFRNAINNGLLVMICEGITKKVKKGDDLEIDMAKGKVLNISTGEHLQSVPIPDVALEILRMGGYIAYTKKKLSLK